MIKTKEHNQENLLNKKLQELEVQVLEIQKKIDQESAYVNQLESIIEETKKSQIITIKGARKISFVEMNDIICCSADEGYTNVHFLNGKVITATKPLTVFDKILKHDFFFKISKSHIININYVDTFHKDRNQILLKGDMLLDVARRRRVDFLKQLREGARFTVDSI